MKKFKMGFSLIEMTIVLVIIGILTATLIPILNTKKIKIKAGERYANEINNVISAEQNYYIKNVNSTTGKHEYANSIISLINSNYLGASPINPFYGGTDGKIKLTINNNVKKGSPNFILTFDVPKDIVGVFFNTIPNLEIVKSNGNKMVVKTTIHIPGLSASLDNLMHRDAGVDQELRTSHGPIQVTDNVNPDKSMVYVTDDNTKTPQNLYNDDANNIAKGKGIIKIGVISDKENFGIIGGDKNGSLLISSNRNNTPGKLVIGVSQNNDLNSKEIVVGVGKYINVDVKKGTVSFYGLNSKNENKKIGFIGYYPSSNQNQWGAASIFGITNPYSKNSNSIKLSSYKDKPITTISMGNSNRNGLMYFNSNSDKPISFIGSIGGIYTNQTWTKYQSLKSKIDGVSCAGGQGYWKVIATGLTSISDLGNLNTGNYDMSFTKNGNIFTKDKNSGPYEKNPSKTLNLNLKLNSTPKLLSYLNINLNGATGKGKYVDNAQNKDFSSSGETKATYIVICLPNNNSEYNKKIGGFYKSNIPRRRKIFNVPHFHLRHFHFHF